MPRAAPPSSSRGPGETPPPSTLAAQTLAALHELLRGLDPVGEALETRYESLLDALLHLVFALCAEARGLLPTRAPDAAPGSLAELLDRLDADAARDPHDLDRRYEVHVTVSARLRHLGGAALPRVSDGVMRRTLRALLPRPGEGVAHRDLEVEAIGAAYERLKELRLVPGEPPALEPGDARRRSGAHYTAREVTAPVVQATLAPLLDALGAAPTPEAILGLRVCDPAMGAGAFLVEACRQLGDELARAWERHGAPASLPAGEDPRRVARRCVARRCLYGVDSDPLAVRLARRALWLVTAPHDRPDGFMDHALREGDALIGLTRAQITAFHWEAAAPVASIREFVDASVSRAMALRGRAHADPLDAARRQALLREADASLRDARLVGDCVIACFFSAGDARERRRVRSRWLTAVEAWLEGGAGRQEIEGFARATLREGRGAVRCFHWELELPEVFPADDARRGFHAALGNPPWISFAGRAAQPLGAPRRAWYEQGYSAFARYKNLQGIFLERLAALGAQGGRVGVVLPSSMAELAGYAPTRAALSRVFTPDPSLSPLATEAFEGVYQPAMVLRGTLHPAAPREATSAPWPLRHKDIDDDVGALLARWQAPPLPRETFGDRGLQTQGADVADLVSTPDARHTLPLREGRGVTAFRLGPPTLWADPARFGRRLRPADAWARVDVVIRQTARVTIAARSDGGVFRNTLLAGFGTAALSAEALLAWLNSSAVRWRHFFSQRDARLGMPQVKVAHLRAIPAPPAVLRGPLHALGRRLGERNAGISPDEQSALDALVFDALGFDAAARARVLRDAQRWT